MSLFLTNLELIELTGYQLASCQVRWLKANGYYVETNARGIPKITYTQVQEKRRPNQATSNTPANYIYSNEPNLAALQQKIGFKNA